MRLTPFKALRYNASVAGPPSETSAPPYAAFDGARYIRHRTANPYTVLQLIAGTPAEHTGLASPDTADFAAARATLDRWRRTDVLIEDPHPRMFVYEEHELRRGVPALQRGIVATLDLADIDDGQLLLHENVAEDRTRMRRARMRQVPVDLTPVVAIHVGGAGTGAAQVSADARQERPLIAFTDQDQIDHRVWRIDDPRSLTAVSEAFAHVIAVLADGHHRVAAAQSIRADLRRQGKSLGRWSKITAWIVDATDHGPELMAVHRLLHGVPPTDHAGAPVFDGFRAWRWTDSIPEMQRALPALSGLAVGMVTAGGSWVLQTTRAESDSRQSGQSDGPLQQLDVVLATNLLLPQLAQTRPAEDVMDLAPVVDRIRAGQPATLLLLRPPTPDQVLAVAAAGLRMPAKTTWFRPKPRAGLLMRALDGPAVESIRR